MQVQMMPKPDCYTYRVIWSEEDEEYVGLCAEFPSLSWLDGTPEAGVSLNRLASSKLAQPD